MIAFLDRAAELKLNAVIFQVRPACDALYASAIEPWSEYLTGQMGKAPHLSMTRWSSQSRRRTNAAWNCMPGSIPTAPGTPPPNRPCPPTTSAEDAPDLVRHYGRQLWLDPGEKEVQDYSLSVVMEVLKRYDVDGIHFDDYFYPYKEAGPDGKELDFPDEASWRRFGAGGKLSREDWRRENVNVFIQRVYTSVKAAKPWVKFGVSPFGIWRPGNPPQIRGYDAYDELYADARKWLREWLGGLPGPAALLGHRSPRTKASPFC